MQFNNPYIIATRAFLLLLCICILTVTGFTQLPEQIDTTYLAETDTPANNNQRLWITGGTSAVFFSGSLIALNHAWYKDYQRTPFHTFNDSKEWLQVDKAGHTWSVYNLSKQAANLWHWSGLNKKNAVLAGSVSSLAYISAIEYLDGRSAKWGWSWADVIANITGAGLFAAQEFAWQEQRLLVKFSAHTKSYDASLTERTNDLFGAGLASGILKDYNNQTYWISANIKSFIPGAKAPGWLNVALGYGADGMLGGFENAWTDKNGNYQTRFDINRTRQFYLSPDIDFTRIPTNKKGLKVLFQVLNAIKVPAPTVMMDSRGKLKFYTLYF